MRLALAAILLALAGCATRPPIAEPEFVGQHRNACLPEAAAMAEGLSKSGITARVLLITTPDWKHAVTVYLYPPAANRLWVWDSTWKSNQVRAWWSDPAGIAQAWLTLLARPEKLTSATFL
jgi:hypothetical protein